MERVLLYYPTIEFPKNSWLKQALLYSDKVSSILPYTDETKFPDTVKYLHHKGEYKPIFIEDCIQNHLKEYNIFAREFLHEIDHNPEIFTANSLTRRKDQVNSLFSSKLSHEILRELKNRNLAQQNNDDTINLPENIAIYYMSFLAKFIASLNINNDLLTPSTDYQRFKELSYENGNRSHEVINLIFENCLPIPNEDTEISDIIDFKLNHSDDLKRFRHFYLDTQNTIKTCRDNKDIQEALIVLKEKIEIELSEVEALYSKNKIDIAFTSLKILSNIESPKLYSSLVTAGLVSANFNPTAGLIAGAITASVQLINKAFNKPKNSNALNYLFEAQKHKIITSK